MALAMTASMSTLPGGGCVSAIEPCGVLDGDWEVLGLLLGRSSKRGSLIDLCLGDGGSVSGEVGLEMIGEASGVVPVEAGSYRRKNCRHSGVCLRSLVRSPKALSERRSAGASISQCLGKAVSESPDLVTIVSGLLCFLVM